MKIKSFTFVSFLATGMVCASCARHFYDFTWKAVVEDAETGKPVPFCMVQAESSVQINMDQSIKERYITQSDLDGNFSIFFHKGYEISSRICAAGYQPFDWNSRKMREPLPSVIALKRMPHSNMHSISINGVSNQHEGGTAPFVGLKYNVTDSLRPQWSGAVGFDLLNAQTTTHTDSADLWLESANGKYPVLCAAKAGGIYAVLKNTVNSNSDFLRAEYAPDDVYVSKYQLTGNEICLFVKCRDGKHFARISPEPMQCIKLYQEDKICMKEIGFRFDYAIQKDLRQPRYFPEALIRELSDLKQQKTLVDASESSSEKE